MLIRMKTLSKHLKKLKKVLMRMDLKIQLLSLAYLIVPKLVEN